ncbi:dentin sialophosphoprotein-like [Galleria mellonella]|uniref:Dentin sialophosphoprotein-like n=1 Tax=Galleria mellonella TaxID=7137 RepID=A0ABM3MAC7_GALME|nr:dentin sialophosphoprotein-like [Galleria mellonella]
MSLKLIVLAALVVVVTPSPTALLGGGLGGEIGGGLEGAIGGGLGGALGGGLGGGVNAKIVGKPWWSGWCRHDGHARTGFKSSFKSGESSFLDDDYKYREGDNIFEPFGFFAKGVTNNAGDASSILSGISSLKYAGSFDDSIDVMLRMARAARGIIDVQIPGLGSLFGNSIMAIARIVNCVVDKRTDLTPAVCNNNYGSKWGWSSYTGGYANAEAVLKFYDLLKVRAQIDSLVGKYTNGKGVGSLTGANKVMVELMTELGGLFDNNRWSRDDMVSAYSKVSSIMGLLGNSYYDGLGDDLVDSMIAYAERSFKTRGYSDLSSLGSDIKKRISGCGRFNFNGALRLADSNSSSSSISDSHNNLGIDTINDGFGSGVDRSSSSSSKSSSISDSGLNGSSYSGSRSDSNSLSDSVGRSSSFDGASSDINRSSLDSSLSDSSSNARSASASNSARSASSDLSDSSDFNSSSSSGRSASSDRSSSNSADYSDSSNRSSGYSSSSKKSSNYSSSSKSSKSSSSSDDSASSSSSADRSASSRSSADRSASSNSFGASSAKNAEFNNEFGSSSDGLKVEGC